MLHPENSLLSYCHSFNHLAQEWYIGDWMIISTYNAADLIRIFCILISYVIRRWISAALENEPYGVYVQASLVKQ